MEENTRIRGLFSIVKFIENTMPSSPNRLVTMTLGKYGFVSTDYDGPSPRHDEFWLVRIDREIKANSLKGCFVLTPVKPIDRKDISYLVPGLGQYSEYSESGIRYMLPVDKDRYYVLALEHRKDIKSVRSVIVVNFSLAQFIDSDRYFHFPNEAGYTAERASYNAPVALDSKHSYTDSQPKSMSTPYDGN